MGRLWEKEIEEILGRVGSLPHAPPPRPRRRLRLPRPPVGWAARLLSPSLLLWTGVVLLVVAWAGRFGARVPVVPLFWAGLGLLILAFLRFNRRPRPERRWRGKPIDTPSSWWDRFRGGGGTRV